VGGEPVGGDLDVSRFLIVVPPLTGHTNPTVSVGSELTARGHDVAWVAHPEIVADLLPPGARLIAVSEPLPADAVGRATARAQGLRGAAAFQFLWEEFLLPLARSMVPGVEAAVDEFRPDVLLVDQQALSGAVVARRRGMRWATSATTSAEFTDPYARLPRIGEWVENALRQIQRDFGVPEAAAARSDPRFSEHLVIIFSTQALVGPQLRFPGHYHFVGPSIAGRVERLDDFPWDWFGDVPRVLVSLGTVNADAGDRFYATVIEALGGRDLQVILVGPRDRLEPVPANILVRDHIPQLAVLDRVNAVVSHAGHNTVCETLVRGLPLVVAPIRDDQPVIAQQVVDAGAGVRVRFGRVRPPDLAAAVDNVLTRPSFREAAQRIRASFETAGGPAAAARALETLAC
jgi:MGT family glycosyltransferase